MQPNIKTPYCKKCGYPKAPGGRSCPQCYSLRKTKYHGREPLLEKTKMAVREYKRRQRQERLAYLSQYNKLFAKKSPAERHLYFHFLQIALSRLLNVFEFDFSGDYVLYEDRLSEFQQHCKEARDILMESAARFAVRESATLKYPEVVAILRQKDFYKPDKSNPSRKPKTNTETQDLQSG